MARDPQMLVRAVAVIVLIAAALAAAVQLDGNTPPARSVDAQPSDDPLRAELARCRTITPEEHAADTACQEAWAENRRRFLTPASDGRDEE